MENIKQIPMPDRVDFPNLRDYENSLYKKLIAMEQKSTMVNRGWAKHTAFWGQEEAEEHSAAVAGKKVCYFCLAELEEKYGIEVAIKTGYIPYN